MLHTAEFIKLDRWRAFHWHTAKRMIHVYGSPRPASRDHSVLSVEPFAEAPTYETLMRSGEACFSPRPMKSL